MRTSVNRKLWPTLFLTAVAAFSACRDAGTASRSQPSQKQKGAESKQAAQQQQAPQVQIFADEAMLRKPYAVLGGTVRNVGAEKLGGLVIELELRRRADGVVERREVPLQPADISPGGEAKYSLKVLSDEFGSTRVARLLSGEQEVAHQVLPGAKRPPERMPDGKEIIVKAPRKPGGPGEEFINTPDTAVSVP
jgi:hypothetical protein